MNDIKKALLAGVVLFIIVTLNASVFVVNETEQYIITQLGKPVREPITQAGLNFKIPFFEKKIRIEKRILQWDGYPNQIPTRDKKYIKVDTTARWKVVDPLKFIETVRTEQGAQSRLDDIIDSATREAISRHNLVEVVRNTNRIMDQQEENKNEIVEGERLELEKVDVGRDKIEKLILENAAPTIEVYGIQLIDVRIKRLNYENSVQNKVFDRMISERKQIAEKLRSEGLGKKEEIEGKLDRELKEIQSKAYKTAQEIKGKAEAKATAIYAEAYNRDSDFYNFSETLNAYEKSFDSKMTLFLSSDGEFLKILNN